MTDAHSGRRYAEGEADGGQDPYQQQQQYYDGYGRPRQYPQHPQEQYGYDPYAAQPPQAPQQQGGYGYDPYSGGPQHYQQPQQPAPGEQQWIRQQQSYDTYAPGPVPPQPQAQPRVPQQPARPPQPPQPQAPRQRTPGAGARPGAPPPGQHGGAEDPRDYRTEQFSFVEEPDDDADDVIDWLKFAETRTERRDERKRKTRNRITGLVVVLVLALAGGVGYLWFAGKLPGMDVAGAGAQAAGGAQQRDVIVVHLRNTKGGGSSTALLVDNETTKKGTTVLLPNSLALTSDDGSVTTLGKSVERQGTEATRDALGTLLGAEIKGSWRLDTPYLENLVESVGGIVVDTDTTVPGIKKGDDPLVKAGRGQTLGGQAAVGYATYRAPGEAQNKQLLRFGTVMQAVLRKVSSDAEAATTTVKMLNQIPDPSLSEEDLGASLAKLAEQAKNGSYQTALLPVQTDGTLSERGGRSVVKDVLGGTVKNTRPDAAPRVSIRNASGGKDAAQAARVALVNGGYTVVDGGTASVAQAASRVTYADAAQAERAKEIAKTLGLPTSAVTKGRGASNADVTVILGQDYQAR